MFAAAAGHGPVVASEAGETLGTSTEPLAVQGDIVLTQGEIDAAFDKVPPEHRLVFIRNGDRVNQVIQTLLRNRALAQDAREAGYDQSPLAQQRMALAAEKELADAWLDKVTRDAPEADYEALAKENYLSNPDQFKTAEMVDVSHLLISSEVRPDDQARTKAEELRAEIMAAPSRFESLVMEFSEDPSKASNGGRFPKVVKGQMVAAFEEMAFSMEEAGEVSPLVKTSYGYHIIRLNGRTDAGVASFEQVRDRLIETERKNYQEEYRARYLRRVITSPIELPEGAVEAMVRRYYGENLELAPQFDQ
jgi:peptidyl-prolyl cis-trans isomerase C